MTEDPQLRADLTALAGQVRADRLDLPALAAVAQRRRRRRQLAVVAPGLLALLVVGGLLTGLSRTDPDTLTIAQPPAATGLRVAVTATVRAAAPGLSVDPDPASSPVGHPTRLRLVWTLAPGAAPVLVEPPGFVHEVAADEGGGVLGVTDGHCWSWDSTGRGVPNPCPPRLPEELRAGGSTTTDLVVYDVVAGGRTAAGVYRFSVDAAPLGVVDVVLTVTGRAADPSPPAATPTGGPAEAAPPYRAQDDACAAELPAGTVRTGGLRATDQVTTAVVCRHVTATSPVVVRTVTGEPLRAIVEALREPSLPQGAVCDASMRSVPDFALQLADGRWVHPEVPSDGCHPTAEATLRLTDVTR